MNSRLVTAAGPALAVLLLATGCSGSSEPAPSASSPSAGSAAAVPPGDVVATKAVCDEINRLTREKLDGLTDSKAADWEAFAVSLQSVANGIPVEGLRTAITDMATAALTTSEALAAGKPLGPALTDFEDTIPAVDGFCKKAGMPLN